MADKYMGWGQMFWTDYASNMMQSRLAQDNYMLYKCLMRSITEELKTKIYMYEQDYSIGRVRSGTLLLKVLYQEAIMDTNATINEVHKKLEKLDEYMRDVNSDISKFNQHIEGIIIALQQQGKSLDTLEMHLYHGYQDASDEQFRHYIDAKHHQYIESNPNWLKPKELM